MTLALGYSQGGRKVHAYDADAAPSRWGTHDSLCEIASVRRPAAAGRVVTCAVCRGKVEHQRRELVARVERLGRLL